MKRKHGGLRPLQGFHGSLTFQGVQTSSRVLDLLPFRLAVLAVENKQTETVPLLRHGSVDLVENLES